MPYCGSDTFVKFYPGGRRTAARLSCRSWHCADCAPRRQRRLMAELCGGKPNRFITLTIRRSLAADPVEALEKLNKAWVILRRRIKKRYRLDATPSMVVVEKHKTGWPHLHIFFRGPWIDWSWLKEQMTDILDSPHVHIKAIDQHGRAAAYAAKYCTKCNSQIGNKKRYYKTRDYELRPERQDKTRWGQHIDWALEPTRLHYVIVAWETMGLVVTKIGDGFAIAENPP